jgi:hypothetical protein
MSLETIKIICDQNKKRILEFPNDTILDRIILDLWNDIVRYMDYHPFVIANASETISGYRKIKAEEFEKDKFLDYYFKNYGIKNMSIKQEIYFPLIIGRNYVCCKRNHKIYGTRNELQRIRLHIDLRTEITINDEMIMIDKDTKMSSYRPIYIQKDIENPISEYITLFIPNIS